MYQAEFTAGTLSSPRIGVSAGKGGAVQPD